MPAHPVYNLGALIQGFWKLRYVWLLIVLGGIVIGMIIVFTEASIPIQAVVTIQTNIDLEQADRAHPGLLESKQILEIYHDPQFITAVFKRINPDAPTPTLAEIEATKQRIILSYTNGGMVKLYVQADSREAALAFAKAMTSELVAVNRRLVENRRKLLIQMGLHRQDELLANLADVLKALNASGFDPIGYHERLKTLSDQRWQLKTRIAETNAGSKQEKRLKNVLKEVESELDEFFSWRPELIRYELSYAAVFEALKSLEESYLRTIEKNVTIVQPLFEPQIWDPLIEDSILKKFFIVTWISAIIATLTVLLLTVALVVTSGSENYSQ
ncbi:hypothetical protein ACFL27_24645 [candidate division CSSED10-310 bacterium]|uniref:Polysaccharide chain length determinant N-terminal domain-containing protein n=1 Tax=candidate division CSSED10-310 bacterium TaxID=2855610 RepID=A0ABV6Z4N1_UNCC1